MHVVLMLSMIDGAYVKTDDEAHAWLMSMERKPISALADDLFESVETFTTCRQCCFALAEVKLISCSFVLIPGIGKWKGQISMHCSKKRSWCEPREITDGQETAQK